MRAQVEVAAQNAPQNLVLHWAVDDWRLPPGQAVLPPGTVKQGTALQTPFTPGQPVRIEFPEGRGGCSDSGTGKARLGWAGLGWGRGRRSCSHAWL